MDVEKPSSSLSKWRKLWNKLRENKIFKYFYIVALFLGFLATGVVLVAHFAQDPYPENNDLKFQVIDISSSPLDIRSSKINFHLVVQFLIQNPLKSNVIYRNFTSSLFYQEEIIAQNSTSPFVQPMESYMQVNAIFIAKEVSFSDKQLMDSLLEDSNFGAVTFDIEMHVETDSLVDLLCADLIVLFGSDGGEGKFGGPPNDCNVVISV